MKFRFISSCLTSPLCTYLVLESGKDFSCQQVTYIIRIANVTVQCSYAFYFEREKPVYFFSAKLNAFSAPLFEFIIFVTVV